MNVQELGRGIEKKKGARFILCLLSPSWAQRKKNEES